MNRRQFLTGASAIAVSTAMPAAPVLASSFIGIDLASISDVSYRWCQVGHRIFWIIGKDNVIHFENLCETFRQAQKFNDGLPFKQHT